MHPVNYPIKEVFGKLRPALGPRIDRLWQAYVLDPASRPEIESLVLALADKHLGETYQSRQILLEPPSAETAWGELALGKVVYKQDLHPFGLREAELVRNLSIFGQPGSGKTNVARLLIWNLLKAGKPFLILDTKRNYRHLLAHREGKGILVLTPGIRVAPLFWNPLLPPDESNKHPYLREVISLLLSTYFPELHLLSVQGVEYLLLRAMDSAEPDKPVTFRGLLGWAQEHKAFSREKDWQASALNVLYKLATGPIGEVFNTRQQPIGRLLDRQVIIELDNLGSPKDKAFFAQVLLLWIYYYRLKEGKSGFRHLTLIEEAHNISRPRGQEGVIEFVFRQIREYGEALVLIDQHPSLTSIPGIGNTYCTIALNLKSAEDLVRLGQTLLLEDAGCLSRLPVGFGIVKLQGRHFKPFLVRFPQFPEQGQVTDQMVKAKMEPYFAQMEGDSLGADEELGPSPQERLEMEMRKMAQALPGKAFALLLDVADAPFDQATKRYGRLGLGNSAGYRLKEKLLQDGLLTQTKVSHGSGKEALLRLTDLAERVLAYLEFQAVSVDQWAGLEHERLKHRVADMLHHQLGWQNVRLEHVIGQDAGQKSAIEVVRSGPHPENARRVDIHAEKNGKKLAFEIETGKSDYLGNIRKCLGGGYDRVVVVAVSKAVKETVEEKALQHPELRVVLNTKIAVLHQGEVEGFLTSLAL